MAAFSKKSFENLSQCHTDLQILFSDVIQITDCSVICGHRGEFEQTLAFERGYSKVKFPNSKHNSTPSLAADVVPYPIDWTNIKRFIDFGNLVMSRADALFKQGKIKHHIEWGGTWNWKDYPHYQIRL